MELVKHFAHEKRHHVKTEGEWLLSWIALPQHRSRGVHERSPDRWQPNRSRAWLLRVAPLDFRDELEDESVLQASYFGQLLPTSKLNFLKGDIVAFGRPFFNF
jgi:hypothetical protein